MHISNSSSIACALRALRSLRNFYCLVTADIAIEDSSSTYSRNTALGRGGTVPSPIVIVLV